MIEPDHFDEKPAGGGSGPTICSTAPPTLRNARDNVARIVFRHLFTGDGIDGVHRSITSRHRVTTETAIKSFLRLRAAAKVGGVANDDVATVELQPPIFDKHTQRTVEGLGYRPVDFKFADSTRAIVRNTFPREFLRVLGE